MRKPFYIISENFIDLLKNISDAVSTQNTDGFVDGNTNPSLNDYEYDVNDFRVKKIENLFCEESERSSMIKDRNKGIENITYNHLKLPTKVTWANNKYIAYQYNAAGQKIRKTVEYSDSLKIVDYLDGFQTEVRGSRIPYLTINKNNEQYTGTVLQFFLPIAIGTNGYVKATPLTRTNTSFAFNYIYNYTDHLDERIQSTALDEVCERSSVRISYTKDPITKALKIVDETEVRGSRIPYLTIEMHHEQNHYYPFASPEQSRRGLKHGVYVSNSLKDFKSKDSATGGGIGDPVELVNVIKTEYQFKYNSKEWQDELGFRMYDYGWRNYDPAIGRWVNIDPMAEKFYPSSTYNYTVNNPILLNDPDGRDWSINAKKDKDGNWQINITVNAAVVNNSGKKIDLDNYIKEQTAQFNRIFSFEGEGIKITANLNMRAINSENDIQGSEHLIAIGNSKNFASNVGGHAHYGGLRVDINSEFINKDGTTSYNHTFSHEIGHTGGLIHPFSNNEKVSFFNGYSWFGLKENRTEVSVYNQKVGVDLSTNFMSYPQKYYKYNASTVEAQKLKNVLANPGRITAGQYGALIRYYSKGLLNKDNR